MSGVEFRAVSADEADTRLDRWFRRHYPALSHGRLEKLLRTGQIRLDGRRAKSSTRLAEGQTVRVPPAAEPGADGWTGSGGPSDARAPMGADEARRIRASVIYRDASVIALNKPAGLAVQGGSGVGRHVDAMLDALRFGLAERPRLAHRLDKDTSGVLLIGRTLRATAAIAEALRRREARKTYWAVVVGVPRPSRGSVDLPLAKQGGRGRERMAGAAGGKRARTGFRVVETAGRRAAWVELSPETGRTHQLRVHMAAIGTPILGDGKYGGPAAHMPGLSRRLHLHARSVDVRMPEGLGLSVSAPLPSHMSETWEFFGFGDGPDGPPRGRGDLR